VIDPRHDRGGLPVVAAEVDYLEFRVKRRLLAQLGERAIAAPVIDGNDFERFLECQEDL
jgi:hypothetical protein